jgi:hypothetical protein
MFVEVEKGFRFPIPLKNIYLSELQIIQRLHLCRREGRQLLGQAKISDRQTIIFMSYFLTIMVNSGDVPLESHPP